MPTGFVTFEAIRKEKHGGTLCAIREELNPKLIEEYNNNFELLVVEVEASNKNHQNHNWMWPSGKLV